MRVVIPNCSLPRVSLSADLAVVRSDNDIKRTRAVIALAGNRLIRLVT